MSYQLSRRRFLQRGISVAAAGLAAPSLLGKGHSAFAAGPGAAVAGPFQPSWDSLAQYQYPDWFRDAKFGIWAHWGPQCQPGQGDWYARHMYIQGHPHYKYQCAHYGHPSKAGFKDTAATWRAESWDPEHLLDLYKKAGAKYFMALANHHDNFDTFDSTYQHFNSVKIGPKKDLIGGWEKATRAAGLRFAVSVHAAHAWSWYEVAQGSDKTGPLAGVPYDGKMTEADGKGLWWDGLDPQDLYAQAHVPGKKEVWDWQVDQGSSTPDQAYSDKLFNRTIELIDKYNPDLLYFDDTVMPLYNVTDIGLRIAAYLYNKSLQRNNGTMEAVMTGKGLSREQQRCLMLDIERGVSGHIEEYPWQSETCIGRWHYDVNLFNRHGYQSPDTITHLLVDTVSKNGNFMLSIPLPGSGEPDSDELMFLANLTAWMDINGPGIYGTRPWKVYGEGPVVDAANARQFTPPGTPKPRVVYTAEDIRFVQKKNELFAFALAWPDNGTLAIKSLNTPASVKRVEALGAPGVDLTYQQDANGLSVTLPAQRPGNYVYGFKILGDGITTI